MARSSCRGPDPLRTNPLLVRTLVDGGAQIAYVIERKGASREVYLSIVEGHKKP
jgi:hypothetical protein